MKSFMLMFVVALSAWTLSASANTPPSPEEMAANYGTCSRSDVNWMSRFGQYVVAFDYNDAVKACQEQNIMGPSSPRLTGCSTSAGTLWAGYYCEDLSGGDLLSNQTEN